MGDLREALISRLKEIGYRCATPNKTDLIKWRKPKHALERMTRQIVWGQAQVGSGNIPSWVDLCEVDDAALIAIFEKSARWGEQTIPPSSSFGTKAIDLHACPPTFDLPWAVEFQVYDHTSNMYGVPDLAPVRAWAKDNSCGDFAITMSSFVLFETREDATLCLLRFKS